MNLKKFILTALTIIFVIAGINLLAQHKTSIEDAVLGKPVEQQIKFLYTMAPNNSQLFELRVRVIRELGKKGNNKAINVLMKTIEEGNARRYVKNNKDYDYWKVRAESALSLGKIGNKNVWKILITAASSDRDLQVRICAIRGLGMLKAKIAVPRMLDYLQTTTRDRVANELVKALGQIGDKTAFSSLLAVTQRDFTADVRKNALIAIKKLKW